MDPKNKVQPYKTIYKPINKDDEWYDNFDDIVFRYNLKDVVKTSMNEASKGAINYFSDLKYYYQKAFRYLDVEEREEYKQLAKDFFSRLQIDDKVRSVGLEESSSSEEKRIAKRAIKSIAKYRGVGEDEARNDLIRAAKELGSLKEAIKEIFECVVWKNSICN